MGREQEIDLYKTLLEQAKLYSAPAAQDVLVCNMLLIQGIHRQGKSRMLEECSFVSDSTIPMVRFNLSYEEYQVGIFFGFELKMLPSFVVVSNFTLICRNRSIQFVRYLTDYLETKIVAKMKG